MEQAKLRQIYNTFQTFWKGFQSYRLTGETPEASYHALRALYVQTNGWFNDTFQLLYGLFNPPQAVRPLKMSLLNGAAAADCQKAVAGLKKDGFYVFPKQLPQRYQQELMKFALRTPAILQSADQYVGNADITFDPANPIATNYRFSEEAVVTDATTQTIMADPLLLSIAQQYFKSSAIIVSTTMWWTTPFRCTEASSRLAQLFHFDMDRIKFMKFFIYLTDVDSDNGPHCYVRGSCQRKPAALLEDRRFQDGEIQNHFKAGDFTEICAPAGTIIAVDTRGFHKAKMPTRGNRLILELEFASCTFGQNYKRALLPVQASALREAVTAHPHFYSNYEVTTQTATAKEPQLAKV